MFKVAAYSPASKKATVEIMDRIYRENPKYWPYGLSPDGFDGGLYLIREKQASTPVGFCGWQERNEIRGSEPIKVGYYSIGILPEFRQNRYAKQAISQLITRKSAGVDEVRALIVESNSASRKLADTLGVRTILKKASWLLR